MTFSKARLSKLLTSESPTGIWRYYSRHLYGVPWAEINDFVLVCLDLFLLLSRTPPKYITGLRSLTKGMWSWNLFLTDMYTVLIILLWANGCLSLFYDNSGPRCGLKWKTEKSSRTITGKSTMLEAETRPVCSDFRHNQRIAFLDSNTHHDLEMSEILNVSDYV